MASREDQEYSSQAPAPYIGQFLQQGIFPYAQQFLNKQFQNYGEADSSPFTYTGQRVAEFDPREQYGMELADSAIGSYRPYLGKQSGLLDEAAGMSRGSLRRGQDELTQGIGAGRALARRAEQSGYGSTEMYDPSSAESFYNPYEQQVVDQTMKDVREGLSKGDMGMRDEAVSGGAFGGSRSRMRRDELAENTARGAAEQIGALRNQGFGQAQAQSQQAFESQQGRQSGLAGLQANLGAQSFDMGLGGAQGFSGMGHQTAQGLGQYGGQYGGMASLLPSLQQNDIQSQMGMGGLGRGRKQSLMDLNYQNYTGQYNLPMQTLQNVGALTASLGPMAGGFGYAGGAPAYNNTYAPSGNMGGGNSPGANIPYNPFGGSTLPFSGGPFNGANQFDNAQLGGQPVSKPYNGLQQSYLDGGQLYTGKENPIRRKPQPFVNGDDMLRNMPLEYTPAGRQDSTMRMQPEPAVRLPTTEYTPGTSNQFDPNGGQTGRQASPQPQPGAGSYKLPQTLTAQQAPVPQLPGGAPLPTTSGQTQAVSVPQQMQTLPNLSYNGGAFNAGGYINPGNGNRRYTSGLGSLANRLY